MIMENFAPVMFGGLVLTVGIGCIVVMVMKGPAYVADAYPMEEPPRATETKLQR